MPLKRERFAMKDAQRGEQAPAAEQAGLPGRQAHLLDGQYLAVVMDEAMDHILSIVAYRAAPRMAQGKLRSDSMTQFPGEPQTKLVSSRLP